MEWSFGRAAIPPRPAAPSSNEPPMEQDEVIRGEWGYFSLQMANKYCSPKLMVFRKTIHGEDQRLKYILHFLDVRGQRVLEIGPWEGYHSIILEKMGVSDLVCVEARDINVAKCLRIKEKYHLDRTTVIKQDIEKIINGEETAKFSGAFDLVFCLGVLYHLPNPAKGLEWMRSLAPTLFLGTHIYDPESAYVYSEPRTTLRHNGQQYEGLTYSEHGLSDPLSGMSATSFWPTRGALLRMIANAGYQNASVLGWDMQHRVPHLTILAKA